MPGPEKSLTAQELGDEPALIRRHVPWVWLGISKDRYGAACALLQRSPDLVFILDDGFQHRKLVRTLDILVIDCSQPLSEDRVFPRGSLREPLDGMSRAQVIMLNLGSTPTTPAGLESYLRGFNASALLLHCRQTIEHIVPFQAWCQGSCAVPAGAPGGKGFLVAAIGNPRRFQRDAEYAGIEACGSRYYRDHYRIEPQDWRSCAEEAREKGADFLLTTEKDAIKATQPPDYPLRVAVQSISVQEEEEFRNLLRRALEVGRCGR
jgi:tetraacyldisaccharide 4'-kinase